jgi:ADP-heptose:LPS heptosyltransferase
VTRNSPVSGTLRTLIYHDGALGDVLLSLPCLQALRAAGDALHFVGSPDMGRLLSALEVVDDFTSSDSGMFATMFASGADEQARAFLSRFERALVFTLKQDSALARSMIGAIPETRTIATVPPEGVRTHVADFRLAQVAGTPQAMAPVLLTVPQAVREAALRTLVRAGYEGRTTLIAIQPGSGGKRKCWPLERYFEAAVRLGDGCGSFILFLSGPAEEPAMRERIGQFVAGRERMAHLADADLAAVAGILSRCDLALGNDSGISHLAAAVGCPVITLFGPTDPALWRPRGHAVQVIAAEAMGSITADQVAGAAEEMLSRHAGHHRTI